MPRAFQPLSSHQCHAGGRWIDIRVGTIAGSDRCRWLGQTDRITREFRRPHTAGPGRHEEGADRAAGSGGPPGAVRRQPAAAPHGWPCVRGMLFDIGHVDGIVPVLAVPERPVPDGTRAGLVELLESAMSRLPCAICRRRAWQEPGEQATETAVPSVAAPWRRTRARARLARVVARHPDLQARLAAGTPRAETKHAVIQIVDRDEQIASGVVPRHRSGISSPVAVRMPTCSPASGCLR